MNRDQLSALLADVAAGTTPPAEALEQLAELPYADLGFARLDFHRELRNGLPEAVYAEGKTPEDLRKIAARFVEAHGRLLVTRLSASAAEVLCADLPQATYHQRARVLTVGGPIEAVAGTVSVLAAGTSDLPVAEEAAVCARWFGCPVETSYDVGVAGLHRLLSQLPEIRKAAVVIAVAGMDGALPTVVASLTSAPVVAVPTSVGYGAAFHGLAPLLTMLNACAPGIGVVNIDNGYGAAVLAHRIARSRQGA